MGFRTLEISCAAELHIKNGQLMVHGANIRLSTMDLSILTKNKVSLMTLEEPVNSRLNYGYAVVRSAIARKLVATGFHTALGIHHDNQLNTFNLADDLIEPYRAMVDLVAHYNVGSSLRLSKTERRELAHVLHNACKVDDMKVNVMASIDIMVESLKRIILDNSSEKLKLPLILPVESLEGITE